MEFPIKISDNLSLAIATDSMAPAMFNLVTSNRQHLREWLPFVDGTKSVEDIKNFIEAGQKQFNNKQGFQAGIFWNNQLVGVCGFHKIDWNNLKTSIGYWLEEKSQGQGIMTAVAQELTRIAFEEWKLNRVEIHCAVKNLKSRKIPEKLGYQLEGIERDGEWLYDHFVDTAVYAKLAGD